MAAGAAPTVASVLGPLGLNDVLSGDGPVTVFLPSDTAATAAIALDPALLETLSDDPAVAASILGFHVVPGTFTSADLEGGASLTTATGLVLEVSADGLVGGVEIIEADLEGTNGVIHLINGILTPPATPALAVTG